MSLSSNATCVWRSQTQPRKSTPPGGYLPLSARGRRVAAEGQDRGGPVSTKLPIRIGPAILAGALLAWARTAESTPQVSPACAIESVGVDTSQANDSVPAIFGEAPGETFQAADTLVSSITVWRAAVESLNTSPMKLWITEVDSAGMPLTDHVVLDGPTLSGPLGDGVHPNKIRYSFDPPIALPRRGRYFFAIQHRCVGFFDLVATLYDVYAGGSLWRTGRSNFSGCILRRFPDHFADY